MGPIETTPTSLTTNVPDREADRLARAALSRVFPSGEIADTPLAEMAPVDAWNALQSGQQSAQGWDRRVQETDPSRDLEEAAKLGGRFVTPHDAEWPEHLAHLLASPKAASADWTIGMPARRLPLGLWVRGALDLHEAMLRSVAVVGARACTQYGERVAGDLGAGLAGRAVTVVSGGSYGVDAASHRGALSANGVTVAVLAGGVDSAYPKGNAALLDRIATDGLVVSAVPPGCAPTRQRGLLRGQLIACLCLGVVVVEASARSGALPVALWAGGVGRAAMAVPGPVTSSTSEGCHSLIRGGKARLVCDAHEVADYATGSTA